VCHTCVVVKNHTLRNRSSQFPMGTLVWSSGDLWGIVGTRGRRAPSAALGQSGARETLPARARGPFLLVFNLVLRLIASALSVYMSDYCDQCFENGARCPRASDSTQTCNCVIKDPLALRTASGGYQAQLQQASQILGDIQPAHIDALLGYKSTGTGTAVVALTAEEQAVLDSEGNAEPWDALDHTNAEKALALVRKRPAKFLGLKSRLEKVLGLVTSQVNVQKVMAFIGRMDEEYAKLSENRVITSGVTTATAYKEATYPMYQLWTRCLKQAMFGLDLAEAVDEKTFFDTSTGKAIVPFEKMPKCKTAAHLFRAFSMFKEAITVLLCLAPRAWSAMEAQVYRTEASLGFLIAQQFVGEVLRRLDKKEYRHVGELLANGEHNRIVDDLRPSPGGPGTTEPKPGGKTLIKIGAVTKQGEFASLVKGKDGKFLVCNQHKNGLPCKAGVAAQLGVDAADVGKCAYHHP
jgi:hypothetical protein